MRFRFALRLLLLFTLLSACGQAANPTQPSQSGQASSDDLVLRLLYGSEKQLWIDAVVSDFNANSAKTASGQRIQVEAVPVGSLETINGLLDGSQQADLWSPASSLSLPLANQRWQAAKGELLFSDQTPASLVLSPVVIGMWKPMAQALGYPDKQIGWADLADLATSGKTWADFGHPEWGAFQFGHTHPEFSNSGLATIVAMAYAANQKTSDLTVADLDKPETASLINAVEQSVIHYGSSTGFFAKTMYEHGPSYLSAAILYENLIIESYDQALYPNLELPMVAIYPKEGSFWSDHPLVVLETERMNADKRAAAQVFQEFLLAQPQQAKAMQYGFRPANVDIGLAAPIDTAHGVDPSQLQVALPTPTAEVLQAITQLWQQHKKQVDVALIIDTSGSMRQENRLREAKTALGDFIDIFADQDNVQVTIFSTNATELSDLSPIGPKRADLHTRIDGLVADGETRLYSTIGEVYADIQQQTEVQRIRALVVLTDGEDTASSLSLEQLNEQIRQDEAGTSIKIFTIAYGSDANQEVLQRIAEITGAKSYTGDPATIRQVYHEIATFF